MTDKQRNFEEGETQHTARLRSQWTIGACILIAFLWFFYPHGLASSTYDGHAGASMTWDDIEPSEKLSWRKCFKAYGDFRCARLTVPIDYSRPLSESKDHPKVHIALVMSPGRGHSEVQDFSDSPLLLNPGGPGGSGTMFLLNAGKAIQTVMGSDLDVVSFDPRGIGATWPRTDCWSPYKPGTPLSDEQQNSILMHRATWAAQGLLMGLPNSSTAALPDHFTAAKVVGTMCAEKDGEDSIFRYAGTPHVAQDMLSIVDAWHEWKYGHKPADEGRGALSTKGKLVYWGYSYGTFLGATFAAMFPDRVGRLVLDGVVDSNAYFTDAFKYAIRDTDKIMDDFITRCAEVRDKCALWRTGDNAKSIGQKVEDVMALLDKKPIVVIPRGVRVPVMITKYAVKVLLHMNLYFPVATFPNMALFLDIIHRQLDWNSLMPDGPDFYMFCNPQFRLPQYPEDSPFAIGCADWRVMHNQTLADLEKMVEDLAQYHFFGDMWTGRMTQCTGWSIKPHYPPAMDWESFPEMRNGPIDTAFPILFTSTTNDPVTPRNQALLMSRRFRNSSVVEQLSDGHTTLSSVSFCSISKIKSYLREGVVPNPPRFDDQTLEDGIITGEWETCEADEKPWKPFGSHFQVEAVQAAQAWGQVQQALQKLLGGGPSPDILKSFMSTSHDVLKTLVDAQQMRQDAPGLFGELRK